MNLVAVIDQFFTLTRSHVQVTCNGLRRLHIGFFVRTARCLPSMRCIRCGVGRIDLPACTFLVCCVNTVRCFRLAVGQRLAVWVNSPYVSVPRNACSNAWSPRLTHCFMKWVCRMVCSANGLGRLTLLLMWYGPIRSTRSSQGTLSIRSRTTCLCVLRAFRFRSSLARWMPVGADSFHAWSKV